MSMVKETTEFTDGYQIAEEVSDVLTKQNKHLLDYVKEFSDIAITKGIFDLNSFNEFPIEFDGVSPNYLIKETFLPLMQEHIEKLDTIRSKLYLSAQGLLEPIKQCGMSLKDYARDIEDLKDIHIITSSIYDETSELLTYERMLIKTRIMLQDENVDNENTIKFDYKNLSYDYNFIEKTDYIYVHILTGKYKGYSFMWLRSLLKTYPHKPNERVGWYIELPESIQVRLDRYRENSDIIESIEVIKASELIKSIKEESK